jgi:hypothetical protein
VTLGHVREELAKMLELSRTGSKAVGPTARTWSSGRVTGLKEAIKLIDKAIQAEGAARIEAAAQGGQGLTLNACHGAESVSRSKLTPIFA